MSKDYYSILGVQKNATAEEIKKSFRRLAHEHHPDKGGDAQKFKDMNEAYQVLGDAKKRQTYDQFGSVAFEQGGMGSGPQGGFGGFGFDPSGFSVNMEDLGDLGDMFGSMFGFGGRQRSNRGQDITVDTTLDFLESIHGTTKTIKLLKQDVCGTCDGSGAEKGTKRASCSTCKGTGSVRRIQRTVFGSVQMSAPCETCGGRGDVAEKPCLHCKGSGVERKTKELTINIPAGISEGEALSVAGEGESPGHGGHPGNLLVRIHVRSHPRFTREGSDILSTVEVPFSTLVLGGTAAVDTADGSVDISIPSGTQPATVFKIRGSGVPFLRSRGRGDHLVTVTPTVPKHLTKEQKVALDDLKKQGL